jgi:hypothetical protein
MPNTLDDKNLEYITLKNISDSSQSLSGYTLADKSKSYTFSDDIFLQSGEREQFFRPQTKLVLNNSDEEIYLYNKNWEKIDEVSYAVSVKSEFLTFEEITQWEEDIISQEAYISWEIFISDEVIIEENVDVVEEVLISPEIIFSLQRPSYITQSWSTDIYTCDRDECKVNFDLWESFSNELPEKDYECDIDFWIQGLTWQEGRCNPNTVTFPKGEFEVKIKIWHESNAEIFTEKVIFIHNPEFQYIETLDVSNNLWGGWSESDLSTPWWEELILEKLYIHKPRIIVQSWLIWEGRYFYCEKTECKINLNYEKKHKDERCFWHFANMQQSSSSTHTRCNPWYVTVKPWTHKMFLRAYEDDNEDNRKTTRFYIYNEERIEKFSLSGNLSQLSTQWRMEQKIEIPQIKINLQWQISHEKSLSGSTLTCEWVEKCYVNLEWIWEWSSEWEYSWLLNWEQFSQKLNPKWIWIEWPWNHEIILRVWDTQESFYVEITTLVFSLTRIQEISNWREMEQWEIKDTESKIDFILNMMDSEFLEKLLPDQK